jgi:hypothetical protein
MVKLTLGGPALVPSDRAATGQSGNNRVKTFGLQRIRPYGRHGGFPTTVLLGENRQIFYLPASTKQLNTMPAG